MDPPKHKWYDGVKGDVIMAMTTTVVHSFFYHGQMHGMDEPYVPPVPVVIPKAQPAPPLDPQDVSLSLLLGIEMEPISPRLSSLEILPLLVVSAVELSSIVASVMMVVSPPYPKYHSGITLAYEEDPSKKSSIATSHTSHVAKPSYAPSVNVLSKKPCIIRTPFVPRG